MALVQCKNCCNEFDDYNNQCPYCGLKTSKINAGILTKPFVCIIAVVAVLVVFFGDIKFSDPLNMSGGVTPESDVEVIESSSAHHNVFSSVMLADVPVLVDENLLTNDELVDAYTSYLVFLSNNGNVGIDIVRPEKESAQTYVYALGDKTRLILALDDEHQNLQAVKLIDSQGSTLKQRLGSVSGMLFAPALIDQASVNDINAQLNYIQQLARKSDDNKASYTFVGHELSAFSDPEQDVVSIELTL